MNMTHTNKTHRRKGFSMVELMAVLVIISLLAGVVMVNFVKNIDKAKVKTTQANLKRLHNAVIEFKLDTGEYPYEEEGLLALVEPPMGLEDKWRQGGYLETTEVPKDAWGNEFIYMLNPESGKAFVIISYGADGEPEGEGDDMDLYSTDALSN